MWLVGSPARLATKYPRIATEHFAGTGRQADIVEVKGSVELAALVEAIDEVLGRIRGVRG